MRTFLTGLMLLVIPASLALSSTLADDLPDEIVRRYDIVEFKNRRGDVVAWTCKIVEENSSEMQVQKFDANGKVVGVFPVDKAGVVSILRRATPKQVYNRKVKRLPDTRDSMEERAEGRLKLGIWCRTPLATLSGSPPAAGKAYEHLLAAVRLQNDLVAAYPHLLDIVAERRGSESAFSRDQELEIYIHARNGAFSHPEIDVRMGEIYGELGWDDRAIEMYRSILESDETVNHSVRGRARDHLAELYLSRGESDLASALFESSTGVGDEGSTGSFDNYYLQARALVSRALPSDRTRVRELLEQATRLQPNYFGVHMHLAALDLLDGKATSAYKRIRSHSSLGDGNPEYLLARGVIQLERGRFKSAKVALEDAEQLLTGSTDPELVSRRPLVQSQIHLARGLLAEYGGKAEAAIEEYRLAWDLAPRGPLLSVRSTVGILLARSLRLADDAQGARTVLDELAEGQASDPGVFAAYARALSDVALAADDHGEAARLLGYAVRHEGKDARLLVKYGIVLLHLGKAGLAHTHLVRAQEIDAELPELHCALGSYHYANGDLDASARLFTKAFELADSTSAKGERAQELEYCREYAEFGLMLVEDARQLEVWEDNFDRATEEILRGWSSVDHFGVRVTVQNNHVVFRGTQTNSSDGVTKLFREEQTENVERISARFRFSKGMACRAGIRIETKSQEGAGVVLARDFDGHVRIALRDKLGEWHDLQPRDDGDPDKGRLYYTDEIVFPSDGQYHTLMIRRAEVRAGGKGFDCLLDGVPVAYNIRVAKFTTKKSVPVLVGVSGQAQGVDVSYDFDVDDFRILRRKQQETRRASR